MPIEPPTLPIAGQRQSALIKSEAKDEEGCNSKVSHFLFTDIPRGEEPLPDTVQYWGDPWNRASNHVPVAKVTFFMQCPIWRYTPKNCPFI